MVWRVLCVLTQVVAGDVWQSDLWLYEATCSIRLRRKAPGAAGSTELLAACWEEREAPTCPVQLLYPGQSVKDCKNQRQSLHARLGAMGGTSLCLVTRYYGDKSSTNTSQSRVTRSLLLLTQRGAAGE